MTHRGSGVSALRACGLLLRPMSQFREAHLSTYASASAASSNASQ